MRVNVPRPSRAYLDFVQGLKANTRGATMSGLRATYEARLDAGAAPPASWRDVAPLLEGTAIWGYYGAASRKSQEMMWDEIGRILQENPQAVAALLEQPVIGGGSLELDPTLELPNYYTAVEFHLRPGGMWDGETQGLLTDLADSVYGRGQNDDHRAQRWVAEHVPPPRSMEAGGALRVLDLGCGIGKASWPLAARFPAAEIHGCDLSAPLLRFAHIEAGERAVPLRLRQANAEATGYPPAWFDVVEAYILFHELPDPAARAVIAEVRRILKPGGIFALADIRSYERQGPFNAFISDWQTANNNEFYWRSHCQRDYVDWLTAAGFEILQVDDSPVNRNSMLYLAQSPLSP